MHVVRRYYAIYLIGSNTFVKFSVLSKNKATTITHFIMKPLSNYHNRLLLIGRSSLVKMLNYNSITMIPKTLPSRETVRIL